MIKEDWRVGDESMPMRIWVDWEWMCLMPFSTLSIIYLLGTSTYTKLPSSMASMILDFMYWNEVAVVAVGMSVLKMVSSSVC